MGKYKVGDVAAMFSKPKEPTTEGKKKLQSLFQDFYGKKGKSSFQPSQGEETPVYVKKEKESKEAGDQKLSKKNRKRKFSSVNESEANDESIHSFKKMKQTVDTEEKKSFEINQIKKAKQFSKQKDFPRKRNKKHNVNVFNSNNNFPKFEQKFDSTKVFGGFAPKGDNQDDKQEFTFTKKSKRQSFESKNDSFSHNQSKLSEKFPGKNLAENSFDSSKSNKIGKQNLNFIKKSKRQSLESKNDSFSHNQNKLSEEVPDKNLANNSFDSSKSNKSGKQKKKQSKPQSLESQNDSLNQNDKLLDEVSNKGSEDKSMKKHKNKKQKSQHHNLESESGSHYQNKLPDEIPDDGDSSLKNEIKEFMKNNSKKFKNNSNDFVPKSPPKVFNQRKNLAYTFKQKSQPKVQSNNVDSTTTEIRNNVPTRQVADFIRNPKKKNRANELQSQKKLDETSNQETTNDNDNLFKSEDEEKDGDESVFEMKKFRDTYLKNKVKALTAGVPEPDFVKLASRTQEDDEKLKRTLFVGNLPVDTNRKALLKLFSVFGDVEQIRFHGVETNKAKIFSKDSSKPLNPNYAADTLPGFIVFKERESAIKAVCLNGTLFKGHHITVDFALPVGVKRMYDEKKSIFIGNLPFSTTDESIWNIFSQCGKIESVRVVRDKATGIGKGFGYVLFSTVESKDNALALKNVEIEGRTIRIKAVDSNKKTQKNLNPPVVKRNSFKSRAIKLKRNNKDTSSRKSINKIMKKQKNIHNKKRIASILQKSMKG